VAHCVSSRPPAKGRRASFTALVTASLFLFAVGLSVMGSNFCDLTPIFSDGVADEMGDSSLCALTNNLSEDFSKQNKTFNGNVVEAIGSKARERLWVITRSRPAPRDQPYAFLKRLPSVEHRGTDTPSVDPD
jgi:hypothetical protein